MVGIWAFTEVWRYPAILPQQWGLRFWGATLARNDVWSALSTSVLLATTVTAISAAICLPAAFAFARLDFPGRNLFFLSFLTVHAFPKFGLYVTIATIFLTLGLVGTFWGVVLIQLVSTLMFHGVDSRSPPSRGSTGGSRKRRAMSAPPRRGCSLPSPCRRRCRRLSPPSC